MCLMRVSVQVCKSQVRPFRGECAVFKSGEGARRSPPPYPWGREGGCVGECVRLKRRARVRRSRSAIKKVGGKSAQMRESEKGRRDEEDDSLLGEVLAERRQKKRQRSGLNRRQ